MTITFTTARRLPSNTAVVEPTVEIDCAFLLGAITIMGILSANKNLLNENKKTTQQNIIFILFCIFFYYYYYYFINSILIFTFTCGKIIFSRRL